MRGMLKVSALALALTLFLPPTDGSAQRRLVRVEVKDRAQFERLAPLNLDIASSRYGSHVDVIVDSGELQRIALLGFKYDVVIEDLESHAAAVREEGLGAHHSYHEAAAELMDAAELHPKIARVDSIGRTYYNRAIWAIKISDNPGANDPSEADILFIGLHHAREVITPDVLLYLMHHLLDNYGTDPHITHLVDDREIWIVPVLNPDGHVHVEQGAFDWRKNMRPPPFGTCVGVDLNRNYGYMWGADDQGSSPNPCNQTYRGIGPFSEHETKAIRDLVLDEAHNFTTAISYHSYGNLILFPWGYTRELTPDHDTYVVFADSMAAYNGYAAGPGYGTIYPTNGDMDDWMYADKALYPHQDPRIPPTPKDRVFAFTFEVGGGFYPGESMIGQLIRENLEPNLFAIEYGDNPYRVWPPAAPEMEEPVSLADGTWRIRWKTSSNDPLNSPVYYELERGAGVSAEVDDFESGSASWEGTGFTVSDERSHSGRNSLHTGAAPDLAATLEAGYPLSPALGDSLELRAWYSMPSGHNFYVEASADNGLTFEPLQGTLWPETGLPRPFYGSLTGESNGWAEIGVSLDAYAGRKILVRLRCRTISTPPGEGIYVDDIGPILTYRQREILPIPMSTATYNVPPSPEPLVYRARGVDGDGQRSRWSPPANVPAFEGRLVRLRVAPNPVSSNATISYTAHDGSSGLETVPVRLEVFDAAGRLVRTLFRGEARRDRTYERTWDGLSDDGSLLPSGVYFVVLSVRDETLSDKVMLISGR